MATIAAPKMAQPLATRALASAASYVVIYGVTFAFFAPPATQLASSGFAGLDASGVSFALLLDCGPDRHVWRNHLRLLRRVEGRIGCAQSPHV